MCGGVFLLPWKIEWTCRRGRGCQKEQSLSVFVKTEVAFDSIHSTWQSCEWKEGAILWRCGARLARSAILITDPELPDYRPVSNIRREAFIPQHCIISDLVLS
jgi:hypothetical protein